MPDAVVALPSLTLPDPVVSGEGALDPLGLASVGDRLADELLPGIRARMNRIRFVTAIAVTSAVIEGLEDRVATDGISTANLVLEWLLVQGFARAGDREKHRSTPGIMKAADVIARKTTMSAKTYLKVPTVFGFHGVYKVLAQDLEIVDQDLRLLENGRSLVDIWEREQGLAGFVERATPIAGEHRFKQVLRTAVEQGLAKGFVDQSTKWQGWMFFAEYLQPTLIGRNEAAFLRSLLMRREGGTRGAVLELCEKLQGSTFREREVACEVLRKRGPAELRQRVSAIEAYETFCNVVEGAFDWIRHLSIDPFRPLSSTGFAGHEEVQNLASDLAPALARADDVLEGLSLGIQQQFHDSVTEFNGCRTGPALFDAVLARHHTVQSRKPPNGKRDWFERTSTGDAIVRERYRLLTQPTPPGDWARPYRISTAIQFTRDLQGAARVGA
jgi:hypothetical protein